MLEMQNLETRLEINPQKDKYSVCHVVIAKQKKPTIIGDEMGLYRPVLFLSNKSGLYVV